MQIVCALLLLCAQPALAAVAFDNSSTNFDDDEGSSTSFSSHSIAGTNRLLLACVQTSDNVTHNAPTYNSVAMTKIGSDVLFDSNQRKLTFWYLINPASGVNTFAMSFSDIVGRALVALTSWTGVHQTTAIGTHQSTSVVATSIAVTVSSTTGELVVDCFSRESGDIIAVMNAGAGQTVRASLNMPVDAFVNLRTSEKAGAASVSMEWTWDDTSESAGLVAVPLKPAAAAAPERRVAPIFFQ